MNSYRLATTRAPALALIATLIATGLTACGGGSSSPAGTDTAASPAAAPPAPSSATTAELPQEEMQPLYHLAPAELAAPSDIDVDGDSASARVAPQHFTVDPALADLDTARLTPASLDAHIADVRARVASASNSAAGVKPAANSLVGTVFSPAQIRAAYGLPALPADLSNISAATAATLGAGQTIYLLDAYHDASALADLNQFSTKFGLPTCTNVAIATNAPLPLAKPGATCTFSTVYNTSAGAMTTTAPAYNSTWIVESKLDVQWAHAIAPLARLVLIESPDSMNNNLLGGIALAIKLGPGVVSMSFGATEAGWAPTVDSKFTGAGMTYVAAAGDIGAVVDWPAVSSKVLAVGGTGLKWTGSGTRYEEAWLKGGGGVSLYEALPSWQSGLAQGDTALTKRGVADVSFNANPLTGQYTAITLPGAATKWSSVGGTSVGAPQWAGIIAVANAMRAVNLMPALGDVHSVLYETIGKVPGSYASAFADVVVGSNGSCALCTAVVGYDTATGLGTPNVSGLLSALNGESVKAPAAVIAPTVPGGTSSGHVNVALSQSLGITLPEGVTTTIKTAGAPAGSSVDSAGTLHWAAPVAGTTTFTVTATTSAGASATGTYTLNIAANTAPVLTGSAALTATAGTAFTATLSATNPNASTLTWNVHSAVVGMTFTKSGLLSWPAPVAGKYTFNASVTDAYGFTAWRPYTLTVN